MASEGISEPLVRAEGSGAHQRTLSGHCPFGNTEMTGRDRAFHAEGMDSGRSPIARAVSAVKAMRRPHRGSISVKTDAPSARTS